MKIAFVLDTMIYGGIERVAISYVKLLSEMGNEVDAYVLNKNTEGIIEELKALCPVKIIELKKEMCADRYWVLLNKFSWGKLAFPILYYGVKVCLPCFKMKYRQNKEYDLAIAFSGHINDMTFVAENFVKAKKKVAWLHGAQYNYRIISWGYYNLYKRIKHLVCLSDLCDAECQTFNKEYGIKKYKLYNPISFAEKELNLKKINSLKQKYGDFCLMVARLAEDKDQKTAILAIKKMNQKYNWNKKLVLVGDGPKRKELETYVKDHYLTDMVYFEGNCSDVENYYASAYVYVHSSPLEGLPTVLLEAMSFSLPIASTDSIPGVREILKNSEYGLISPVGDSENLADKIYTLYANEEIRNNLIHKAEKRIKDFAPLTIREQLQEIINNIFEK